MIRDRRTQYARGADFERKVRDELMHDESAAYVVRSAGSRGIVDLVAFFQAGDYEGGDGKTYPVPSVWLIQCKRRYGKFSAEDRELLMSLAAESGCKPVLARQVVGGVEFEVLADD